MKPRKLIIRTMTIVLIMVAAIAIVSSSSPKNAVRTRISFAGHPKTAFRCDPKSNQDTSMFVHATVWSIDWKYRYVSSDTSYEVTDFKIHQFLFLYFATQLPPSA